jgi:hypothetical protein
LVSTIAVSPMLNLQTQSLHGLWPGKLKKSANFREITRCDTKKNPLYKQNRNFIFSASIVKHIFLRYEESDITNYDNHTKVNSYRVSIKAIQLLTIFMKLEWKKNIKILRFTTVCMRYHAVSFIIGVELPQFYENNKTL